MKKVKILTNKCFRLAEGAMHVGRQKNQCGKAFTLAEVLITLTVVAVLAILTIPTIISNSTERATVSQLKKVYSTLSQAYTLAVQGNGTPNNWGIGGYSDPVIINKIKPYLSVSKDCTDGSSGCFPPGVKYRLLKTGDDGIYNDTPQPKLQLADGTLLYAMSDDPSCGWNVGSSPTIYVCGGYYADINGWKGPNQWGKDVFQFWLTQYGIVPAGTVPETYRSFPNNCKDKSNADGFGCAAWVLYIENLDYLHCNNLDWTGPTKCN